MLFHMQITPQISFLANKYDKDTETYFLPLDQSEKVSQILNTTDNHLYMNVSNLLWYNFLNILIFKYFPIPLFSMLIQESNINFLMLKRIGNKLEK